MNFIFIKESWKNKCIMIFTNALSKTTVFNIDKKTEDWRNDAENSALPLQE